MTASFFYSIPFSPRRKGVEKWGQNVFMGAIFPPILFVEGIDLPMSAMTGIGIDEFVRYGGVTGSASTAQIQDAMQIAWNQVEAFIGTLLYPGVVSEEVHAWPHSGRIQLYNSDVTSITTVIAKHDENTCDCDVTDVSGCGILMDPPMGIVDIKECYWQTVPCSRCSCSSNKYGLWTVVTYVAGLSPPLPANLLMGLVLIAKNALAVLTGGIDEFGELQHITQWRSMDYAQTQGAKKAGNPFSYPSRAEMAFDLLRPYRRKRILAMANPKSPRIL